MSSVEKIGSPILVVVDHEQCESGKWKLTDPSAKVLRQAKELTESAVSALCSVTEPDREALGAAGTDEVLVVDAEGFSSRVPAGVADATLAATKRVGDVGAVFFVSSYCSRAAAAMFATTIGGGVACDVNEVVFKKGVFEVKKTVLSGSWNVKFQVRGATPALVFCAGAGSDAEVERGAASVEYLPVSLSNAAKSVVVERSQRLESDANINLNVADFVVVGGRGVEGNWGAVTDLAELLRAAIGSTRVPCDEGWVGRDTQIGQTGLTISPKLYVGLGVSGAIHHTCGMLASRNIVAVVDDSDAPIVELADLTVIGDVNEIVPAAIRQLRVAVSKSD